MGIMEVKDDLREYGLDNDIIELDIVIGTVTEAANGIGVEEKEIAKTLSFYDENDKTSAIIVVVAGDSKIFAGNFKRYFGFKPRMLSVEDINKFTGHMLGGVCPFGLPQNIKVYLDISLKRFEYVYPACGTNNSFIKISLQNLEKTTKFIEYIDISKDWS
jgi:prolyl-tRNA editing enzyme YbaK/EbsC (Cys-tRNA(Pro) deacylase)